MVSKVITLYSKQEFVTLGLSFLENYYQNAVYTWEAGNTDMIKNDKKYFHVLIPNVNDNHSGFWSVYEEAKIFFDNLSDDFITKAQFEYQNKWQNMLKEVKYNFQLHCCFEGFDAQLSTITISVEVKAYNANISKESRRDEVKQRFIAEQLKCIDIFTELLKRGYQTDVNRLRIDEKIYAFVHSYVGIGFFTLIGMLGFFMCMFVPFMAMDQVRFNNKLKEIEISDKYPEAYAYYEYIHEGKDGSEFYGSNDNTCNCTCNNCICNSNDSNNVDKD